MFLSSFSGASFSGSPSAGFLSFGGRFGVHPGLSSLLASGVINVGTSPTGLPGEAQFLSLLAGLRWYAVGACVVGILLAAVSWAAGAHSENLRWAHRGRLGVVVGFLAAVLIGAAPALVNFAFGVGAGVH